MKLPVTPMKHLSATASEMRQILVWEHSFPALSEDQQSLCIALHRHYGPVHEDELAACLDCTVDDLRNAQCGIDGILVDSSTWNYWIK
jgi:hypothetical protein